MADVQVLTPSRTIGASPPARPEMRLVQRIAGDVRRERRIRRRAALPAGSTAPSWANTRRVISDPLGLLLEHERRFGPVFTIRLLHEPIVWAIGAEVNHQILVSDFDAFSWREGRFADLWPLLGDGMLNIDGPYPREFRMLMLPAFHRDYVAGVAETMIEEAVAASESLVEGQVVEIYHWTRELALRIALRGLLGLDVTGGREQPIARAFEESLAIHGEPVLLQLLPAPGTPLARAIAARKRLDALVRAEIDERRRRGGPGRGGLGLLLAAPGPPPPRPPHTTPRPRHSRSCFTSWGGRRRRAKRWRTSSIRHSKVAGTQRRRISTARRSRCSSERSRRRCVAIRRPGWVRGVPPGTSPSAGCRCRRRSACSTPHGPRTIFRSCIQLRSGSTPTGFCPSVKLLCHAARTSRSGAGRGCVWASALASTSCARSPACS